MEIKAYQKGDENKILELFEICFKKEMSPSYWRWRFNLNPFTENKYIELMWDEDVLVGHYAVSPVELLINEERIFSALSMTTMTHPEYAGKGIFSKLAESLYQKLAQNQFALVWGFPNNNSHYGFNKNLNWKDLAVQCSMTLSSALLKKSENKTINVFSNFDQLEAFFSKSIKKVKIHKTKEYLNWRYIENPSADYKVALNSDESAGLVYKKINSFKEKDKFEIDIMELFHNDSIEGLIGLLNAVLKTESDVVQFNIWDSLFSDNQILLEKIGFRLGNHTTYMGYRELQPKGFIDNYKNWEISFGNSDVF